MAQLVERPTQALCRPLDKRLTSELDECLQYQTCLKTQALIVLAVVKRSLAHSSCHACSYASAIYTLEPARQALVERSLSWLYELICRASFIV